MRHSLPFLYIVFSLASIGVAGKQRAAQRQPRRRYPLTDPAISPRTK